MVSILAALSIVQEKNETPPRRHGDTEIQKDKKESATLVLSASVSPW
jgi:hypothetical protein